MSYNLSADGSHQNIRMGEEWLPWVRRSPRRPKRRWPDADVLVSAPGLLIFVPSLRWHSCVWGLLSSISSVRNTRNHWCIFPFILPRYALSHPGEQRNIQSEPAGQKHPTHPSDEEKQSRGDECDRKTTVAMQGKRRWKLWEGLRDGNCFRPGWREGPPPLPPVQLWEDAGTNCDEDVSPHHCQTAAVRWRSGERCLFNNDINCVILIQTRPSMLSVTITSSLSNLQLYVHLLYKWGAKLHQDPMLPSAEILVLLPLVCRWHVFVGGGGGAGMVRCTHTCFWDSSRVFIKQ